MSTNEQRDEIEELISEVLRLAEGVPGDLMVEPHGDGLALYSGRDSEHHGLRLFNITDGDRHTDAVLDLLCAYRTAAPRLAHSLQVSRGEVGRLRAAIEEMVKGFGWGCDPAQEVEECRTCADGTCDWCRGYQAAESVHARQINALLNKESE